MGEEQGGEGMTITESIRTVSEANRREHWAARHRRASNQKLMVAAALSGKKLPPLPAVITLTRIGKRRMDSDNLAGAFKAVRDQIARTYGVDDGDPRYTWQYAQKIGKQYGIEISIVPV